MTSKYKLNIWKMYLFQFLMGLHFSSGVLVPFYTDWAHLNFTKIMILQSWFLFWIFALEVPTGAIADRFGRKMSMLLGVLSCAIAVIIYTIKPDIYLFLLAEFMWAMSNALLSGANEAFIYDSLKKSGETKKSKKIFGRIESIGLAAIMIAAPIGSIVGAKFGLRMPMLLMSIPFMLAFFIGLTLKEPKHTKKSEPKNYIHILKEGMKFFYRHKILKILAIDMILISVIAYFMIWLSQPIMTKAGISIAYFGFVSALMVATEILIMNNYEKFESILKSKKKLIFISALITGLMFIIAGLTSIIPIILIAIIFGGGFGLSRRPLLISYMNKYIPSDKRATVLSTVSMFRSLTLTIANPIVGYAVDHSLNYTLIGLGAIAIIFSLISKVEERHLKE